MPFASRIERLIALASGQNLSAVAIVPGPNMVYFTGLHFHLSERPTVALFAPGQLPAIILPALEANKPDSCAIEFRKFTYTDDQGPANAFQQACGALNLKSGWLGVEGRRMRVLETHYFNEFAAGLKLEMAEAVIAQLRMRKDASELAHMRAAVVIAEKALTETLPYIRVGVSEREVAGELVTRTYRAGSGELPFMPIVASGPNSALPHAFVTDRTIQPGDLVTIDWGAAVHGYFSDITRTYAVGEIDPELQRAYQAVKAANEAGRAAASPGKTGQDVDRAARAAITAAGLGPFFTHRTGHGLGLEGHEEPDMKEGETLPLEPGMTFTVEPGVYIPGKGGVRIEDNLAMTATGAETMTTLTREFTSLE